MRHSRNEATSRSSHKRVLVLSHNAFSQSQNNGKTLESFFADWDKSALAQIYLQPDNPDLDFCQQYFRITDYEALNNVVFGGNIGHEIAAASSNDQFIKSTHPFIQKLYFARRSSSERRGLNKLVHEGLVHRHPAPTFIRDLVWSLARWKTNELCSWVQRFSPDVLFFQGSNSVFGYKIAFWLCDTFRLPLVLQLTDDYTRPLHKKSLLELTIKQKYVACLRAGIKRASTVITISPQMEHEYRCRFGGTYTTLMNSIVCRDVKPEPSRAPSLKLLYAGNVLLQRWRVLESIAIALRELKQHRGFDCIIHVHSPTAIPSEILARLQAQPQLRCGPSLSQHQLASAMEDSNILVHVESFDEKMRTITRLSVSTKIPEYMASSRCILAVGPSDVASIQYLRENMYAHVIESDEVSVIRARLDMLISDKRRRDAYIGRATDGYNSNHHPRKTRRAIANIVESSVARDFP